MRKALILALLLLLLAACGGAAPDTTTAPEEADAGSNVAPETAAQSGDAATSAKANVNAGTTPEEASIVRPEDHTKGAADPLVTIIEYGDFQ